MRIDGTDGIARRKSVTMKCDGGQVAPGHAGGGNGGEMVRDRQVCLT